MHPDPPGVKATLAKLFKDQASAPFEVGEEAPLPGAPVLADTTAPQPAAAPGGEGGGLDPRTVDFRDVLKRFREYRLSNAQNREDSTAANHFADYELGRFAQSTNVDSLAAVWDEYGRPAVTFAGEGVSGNIPYPERPEGSGGTYHADTNELRVSTPSYIVSELAHADQRQRHGAEQFNQLFEADVAELREENQPLHEAYNRPGYLEHDAHSVIEPKLRERVRQRSPGLSALKQIAGLQP